MQGYQKNNIAFRISSSDAISRFKATQTHSFFQLVRKDIGFYESAKEAVLLEFDRFSDWIFRAERICVSLKGPFTNESLRSIHSSIIDEFMVIDNVMNRHRDVFEDDCVKYSKLIHAYAGKILFTKIILLEDVEIDSGFVKIVEYISEYLQHMLAAMHEFNNNLVSKKEHPFISYSIFCGEINVNTAKDLPCVNRAMFFTERGTGTRFILKNYSTSDIFEDTHHALSMFGIKILHENQDKDDKAPAQYEQVSISQ